jgi:hypothetical protein
MTGVVGTWYSPDTLLLTCTFLHEGILFSKRGLPSTTSTFGDKCVSGMEGAYHLLNL